MASVTWREYSAEMEVVLGELLAELRDADRLTRASVDALRTRVELLEKELWGREEAGQEGGGDDQG